MLYLIFGSNRLEMKSPTNCRRGHWGYCDWRGWCRLDLVWLARFLGRIIGPQFHRLTDHPQPLDYFICVFLLGFAGRRLRAGGNGGDFSSCLGVAGFGGVMGV